MKISTGYQLGSYRVDREIGRGGMGVVFLARDNHLDRNVAIKTLPEFLADSPDRLIRFEQEGKSLAQLNHPNVGGIYGIEEQDGHKFLILEFVPGDTLANLVRSHPMPVKEVIDIADQIAAGLEAAHEVGVVHRDLKPDNIKISPEGHLKILDFGLAKSNKAGSVTSDFDSPTITSPAQNLTKDGMILGTAPYMSPEQASGKSVDKRTDIWAFGCIVFECLTGQRVFQQESFASMLAAILNEEPDFSLLPAETPQVLFRILKRCLAKDPKQRLRDIGDARLELQEWIRNPQTESAENGRAAIGLAPALKSRSKVAWLAALGALIATSIISLWIGASISPSMGTQVGPVKKYDVFRGSLDESLAKCYPQISPSGKSLAFIRNGKLCLRDFNSFRTRVLTETSDAVTIFWSPDGNWLGCLTSNSIIKVDVHSGTLVKIADTPHPVEGSADGGGWMKNGNIVFESGDDGLYTVSSQGGQPELWIETDSDIMIDFHDANSIAESDVVLYVEHRSTSGYAIVASDGQRKVVIAETRTGPLMHPTYSPTGHVLYAKEAVNSGDGESNLWAIPFDLAQLELSGEPFHIVSNAFRPSVSNDGSLVFLRNVQNQNNELSWVTLDGEVKPIGIRASGPVFPVISPDGEKIAYSVGEGFSKRDIWMRELDRDSSNRITFSNRMAVPTDWSIDQSEIAIATDDGEKVITSFYATDGSGKSRPELQVRAWSLDREWKRCATLNFNASEPFTIFDFDKEYSGQLREVLEINGALPALSPDGTLVSFQSDSGHIFCKRIADRESLWQISRGDGGGQSSCWSVDGSKLYYSSRYHDALYRVEVFKEPALRFGPPEKIIDAKKTGLALERGWSVSADGKRILALQANRTENLDDAVSVITNWYEEFREK